MQFIKNNWISLVSGLVALLAIAATVYGVTRTAVVDEMNKRLGIAREIDGLKSSARNQECIDAEMARGRQFETQYTATLDAAAEINRRTPIIEGVFPRPAAAAAAYRFQEVYKDKLYQLPAALMAGGPPSPQELEEEKERLEEEARRRFEEGGTEEPGGGVPPDSDMARTVRPGAEPIITIAEKDAREQAAIRKARAIHIYAEADPERSCFHISPIFMAEQAPQPIDMWFAQVGLWIQEDIVEAIRVLNDAAAAKLAPQDVYVGNMPIKRIVGIRVYGYIAQGGGLIRFPAFAGGSTGKGTGTLTGVGPGALPEPRPSFTGRKGDDQFDVVRFGLVVVADQRELLKLVDQMTRTNFYQLVSLTYEAIQPDDTDNEYLYGGGALVRATLSFEGYMARKVYKAMMPEEVLRLLNPATDGD